MKNKTSPKKLRQLLVISSYPPNGTTHHPTVIGGASYTKETLLHLSQEILRKKSIPDITVLCEKMNHAATSSLDQGIRIKRVWEKGSFLTPFVLIKETLLTQREIKDVLIELELTMFGKHAIFLVLFIPVLLLFRLFGKRITIVFHQAITDLHRLAPHLNLTPGTWPVHILSVGLHIFYASVLLLVNRAIVFEEVLKERLRKYGNNDKVNVIPLAVSKLPRKFSKKQARKQLRLKEREMVIVSFGFLAWYKGTDWLVKEFERKKPRGIRLIIAGGPNPNRIPLRFYQQYIKEIERVCQLNGIIHTGFVKETDMELYFQTADIIIFPYREIISSSYPLSLAFSYNKPVLLSEKMADLLKSHDFQKVYKNGLRNSPLFFPLDKTFFTKLKRLRRYPQTIKKLKNFSCEMAKKRSWKIIQKQYYAVFFN